MKSSISNIVVFDLETSGLKSEENAIIEIACCPISFDLKNLKEYESGVMSVYDNRVVDKGALMANGITMSQIDSGRSSKAVIEELCQYLSDLTVGRNKPVLAGHNIDKFDIPFLQDFFETHKKDISKFVNIDFTIDTMWWARLMWPEAQNYKLGTCCESAQIELVNAHRAINDTRANRDLVKYFLNNFRSESSQTKQSRYRDTFEF